MTVYFTSVTIRKIQLRLITLLLIMTPDVDISLNALEGKCAESVGCAEIDEHDLWSRDETIRELRTVSHSAADAEPYVNTLLGFLQDSDPFVRSEALAALFDWREMPDVQEAARAMLQDAVWLVRRHAFNTLLKNPDLAIQVLTDEDPYIRVMAVTSLRRFVKNPRAFDKLIDRLADPYSQVVVETIGTLKTLGTNAIPYLLSLVKEQRWVEKEVRDAVQFLADMTLEQASKTFGEIQLPLASGTAPVRRTNTSELLQRMVQGPTSVKVESVLALAWAEEPEGLSALADALNDSSSRVRYAAARALQQDVFMKYKRYPLLREKLRVHAQDCQPMVRATIITLQEILNRNIQ